MTDERLFAEVLSPDGHEVLMETRQGTSDLSVVYATFIGDEYQLKGREFSGWAIDCGAHIGVIAAALLADHPDLQVLAIEPIPENVALIRRNLAPFGDRAHILEAAIGAVDGDTATIYWNYTHLDSYDDDYVTTNRFIGGVWRHEPAGGESVTVPVVSLAGVIERYGMGEVAYLKTDTEGAEYAFLSDPAANAKVNVIAGEWHDDGTFGQKMIGLLADTHAMVTFLPEREGITGLFEAVRK